MQLEMEEMNLLGSAFVDTIVGVLLDRISLIWTATTARASAMTARMDTVRKEKATTNTRTLLCRQVDTHAASTPWLTPTEQ